MTFARWQCLRSQLMEHLKDIYQKPQMRPFGADFWLKNPMKVFSNIFY